MSSLPPPASLPLQPTYILRGHTAQIHAIKFWWENTRLIVGDAEGWIVIWNIVTKRPTAVWRAHEGSILTLDVWGLERIISHGRDSALRVWQFPKAEEDSFSTTLPAEASSVPYKDPWLLHSVRVNTLNFCSMAVCKEGFESAVAQYPPILIAVPGRKETSVDIHQLPLEAVKHTVPAVNQSRPPMIMALKLVHMRESLVLVSGTEAGSTAVQAYNSESDQWATIYSATPHKQPVLSLDVSLSLGCFFTSGADAAIARHPLLEHNMQFALSTNEMKITSTGHSGQQSLTLRADSKILATAGWDRRVRIYSSKTLNQLAVLSWHKEGCYAVAFADIPSSEAPLVPAEAGEQTDEAGEQLTNECEESISRLGVQNRSRRLAKQEKTSKTHWLAAGSKDGKVSLWVVY